MVPTSQQVLYHLVRCGFLGAHPDLDRFVEASRPKAADAEAGAYRPVQREAFVAVCGKVFDGSGVPVVEATAANSGISTAVDAAASNSKSAQCWEFAIPAAAGSTAGIRRSGAFLPPVSAPRRS